MEKLITMLICLAPTAMHKLSDIHCIGVTG